MRKKVLLGILLATVFLSGCKNNQIQADYGSDEAFEEALNQGVDGVGKTVAISVDYINPSSAFGYDIYSGEHLNFVSVEDPKVEVGSIVVVKVVKVEKFIGSYIIYYEFV